MSDKEKILFTLTMVSQLSNLSEVDIAEWKEACNLSFNGKERQQELVNLAAEAAIYHKQQGQA